MKRKIINSNDGLMLNRRQFLSKASVATGLVVVNSSLPPLAHALSWREVGYVLKLNVVRFIAGLIFDVIEVVVVYYVKGRLADGQYAMYAGLPSDKQHFNHSAYREAVIAVHPVRYGMDEDAYQAYRKQKQMVVLSREEDLVRFEEIHRYLYDTKTRLLLPNQNVTRAITADLQPTEVFGGDLIFRDGDAERHYQTLLERTNVTVFDNMMV